MMRTVHGWIGAALLALAVGGCSGEVLVGGQREVDAYATGDGSPAPSGSRAPAYSLAPGTAATAPLAEGTVAFAARIALVNATGDRAGIGQGAAVLTLAGRDTAFVAGGRVPEARYSLARVTFTRVAAKISGVGVAGEITVAVGDSLVVERPISLPAGDGPVALLIDLDSSEWISAVDASLRVSAEAFARAVKVRVVPVR